MTIKQASNVILSTFVFIFLLAGCSSGGQTGRLNPNLGQSDSQSPHLKQTGYEKLNQTQKGDDPKNISDPSPTGSKNSDGGQRKIDSIGFLEPAGVAKDPQIVNRVADHLTYVAFFSYRVKSNGSLIPLKDKKALQATKKSRAKPMLVITNFANGTFSSDLGHMILTNPQAKTRLIRNVVSVMKKKNYAALNIDFEHLLPEDRDRYTAFLKRLVPRLHAAGFPVSTSLAPKKSSKQTGSWYSAHDYGAHGKLMDFVILMTYEWGWTGGPPMAVAPIDKVKEVLDYAVTEIPRNKIIMGMPLYGYDWTLPYKKGGPPAKRLGFREAASLAKKEGVNVQYDPNAQSPFFRYTDNQGQKHVVWFENQKSLQAKFNLVKQYHLRGVSYWELGQPSPQNWKLLKQNFRIRQR